MIPAVGARPSGPDTVKPPTGASRPPGRQQGEKSMESYQKLRQLVEQAAEDIEKAEGGNKAAGTRARQTMQEVKNLAQEIRKEILTLRGD